MPCCASNLNIKAKFFTETASGQSFNTRSTDFTLTQVCAIFVESESGARYVVSGSVNELSRRMYDRCLSKALKVKHFDFFRHG